MFARNSNPPSSIATQPSRGYSCQTARHGDQKNTTIWSRPIWCRQAHRLLQRQKKSLLKCSLWAARYDHFLQQTHRTGLNPGANNGRHRSYVTPQVVSAHFTAVSRCLHVLSQYAAREVRRSQKAKTHEDLLDLSVPALQCWLNGDCKSLPAEFSGTIEDPSPSPFCGKNCLDESLLQGQATRNYIDGADDACIINHALDSAPGQY